MSLQNCPSCKKSAFTWRVDDEISDMTIWDCWDCSYQAFENESDERIHSICGKKTESKLKDENKTYWWCSFCDTIELIEENG